jgi:hypothetical protein
MVPAMNETVPLIKLASLCSPHAFTVNPRGRSMCCSEEGAYARQPNQSKWEHKQAIIHCVAGMRCAGERTECPYYSREPGSDDE